MGGARLSRLKMPKALLLVLVLLCTCDCADKKKSKRKKPKRHEERCTDNNPSCEDWAAQGECENNPGFMLTECRESCEECDVSPDEKESKLWYKAVEAGNLEKLKALKKQYGKCHKKPHPITGQTGIHKSAFSNFAEQAQWLIKECNESPDAADPQYGVTPMHLAATFGHVAVMEALLSNHANPNPEDSFERTPLSIAEEKGHKKFTRALESHLAIKGFAEHAYSEEYLEEVRMMDEL